tara:strand:+ start:246 stop:467 length:222 start_codon:yes stop_codon:yes gene_type:complete
MIIKQNKEDGSAEIIFSWKEIWILIKNQKLKFSPEAFKNLTNTLFHIVATFNSNFDNQLVQKMTREDEEIKSE